jgi:hypothetical protein
VNGANEHPYDTGLLDASSQRVMVCDDGAMSSRPQAADSTRSGADAVETKFLQLQSG